MNNKEFCAELAQKLNITQKQSASLIKGYVDELVDQMNDMSEVPFLSIGTFEVKQKEQRIMVSPTTKKRMLIPPKLVLAFRPNQLLKNQIKTL